MLITEDEIIKILEQNIHIHALEKMGANDFKNIAKSILDKIKKGEK